MSAEYVYMARKMRIKSGGIWNYGPKVGGIWNYRDI